MRNKEYCIAIEYFHKSSGGDEIRFPAGTLVFPFFNETLLPDHIKENFLKTKKEIRYGSDPGNEPIMTVIGVFWVAFKKKDIRLR